VLAGIASFTLVYFLQRIAPRRWEDGNQWLFVIPPLLAAIITGVIVGWVIDRTARTTAAFGVAFVTAPFISMCLMSLLRTIPDVNKEAPGLPLIIATVLAMPAITYGAIGSIAAILSPRYRCFLCGFASAFAIAGVVGSILSLFVMRLIGVRPAYSIVWMMVAMQAQALLSLFVAGVGTGFVLRAAHEEVVSG
jgi:F0F1-type ATP synthase assembly protein I